VAGHYVLARSLTPAQVRYIKGRADRSAVAAEEPSRCECSEITGERCESEDEADTCVSFLRRSDRDQARRTNNAEGLALRLHLCFACALALEEAQINACEDGTLNPNRDDCREPDLLKGEIVFHWGAK
jgi:hypothetical protein